MRSTNSTLNNAACASYNPRKLIAGVVFLLLCGIKLVWNFNQQVDITFDDEVRYMRYGLDMFGQIHNDWGPTYNIWYKFLSIFEHQPIALYLLNYKVVVVLLPLCVFVFLYSYGISFFTAITLSYCLLISNTNVITYPRISHVVVSCFLICLIINKLLLHSKVKQYILLSFVLFVGAYARPELMLSFFLISGYTLFYVSRNAKIKEGMQFGFPFLLIMALVFFAFKLPANTYMGKDRLYGVFCQHYTVKYIFLHKLNYGLFIDWMAFCKKQFQDCNTFTDIIIHYPLVILKGILENTVVFLAVIFISISDVLFPKYLYHHKLTDVAGIVVTIVYLGFMVFSKKQRTEIYSQFKKRQEVFLLLFIFALPGLTSSLLFFPRPHYLLFLLIPIIYLLAISIDTISPTTKIKNTVFVVIALILLAFSPNIRQFSTPHIISGPCPNQSYKALIQLLNKSSDKPHVIFSNILNLSMMTDKNFTDFSAEENYDNDKSFLTQLREKQVDYILVTDFLQQDLRLKKDTTWLQFIHQPEQYGFKKKFPFKDCDTYLLYKD